MAARLNPRNQQSVREKIRASQLINRLQNHVDGKVEMGQTQVRAAEVLLRKCLPDLSAIDATLSGPNGGPIQTRVDVANLTDDQLRALSSIQIPSAD